MWSCYGNEGVCIHFNREKLEKNIRLIKMGVKEKFRNLKIDDRKLPTLEIKDVKYYDSTSIGNYFSNKMLKTFDDIVKIFYDSPIIKSNFYKCEEEVRIVYVFGTNVGDEDINYLSLTDSEGFFQKEIHYNSASNNKFNHRMAIDIPIDLGIIEKITLGPNCALTSKDLDELFFINGINENILIEYSKGSYR